MFGSNVNKVLKRNFWIITLVWFCVMIIALLEFEYGMDITKVIKVKENIQPEILQNDIYEFLRDWGIVYLISLFFIFVFWCINNFTMKKLGYYEEEYYRELIKENTPAQLSYIDNLFIETKKDIIATVLMLKLKNKIDFVNGEIRLKKDFDYSGLKKSEAAVLEYIENKHCIFYAKYDLKKLLIEELLEMDMIKSSSSTSELEFPFSTPRYLFEWLAWTIYGIVIMFIGYFNVFDSNNVNYILEFIGGITCATIFYMIMGFIFWNVLFSGFSYHLTTKGKEIRKKLNGLRLFLKDYSDMKNKSLKEIELWDEYMVYSVILNDNKKVQKEVLKMIKEQFK